LTQVASQGSLCCLPVPAQAADTTAAKPNGSMPFVNDRWLGGTLTNFRTIRPLT
jgi:ribosomal protein S2